MSLLIKLWQWMVNDGMQAGQNHRCIAPNDGVDSDHDGR
jgi:hypothetical protein